MSETYIEKLERENRELRDRVHNLSVYLHWFEECYPAQFKAAEDALSGLPGYGDELDYQLLDGEELFEY